MRANQIINNLFCPIDCIYIMQILRLNLIYFNFSLKDIAFARKSYTSLSSSNFE